MIATAESVHGPKASPLWGAAEYAPRLFWPVGIPITLPYHTQGTPIPAVVNAGRWVVQCPDCTGAQMCAVSDPRFLCVNCLNAGNGGQWRPVAVPANRTAIEALLLVRPLAVNRNWLPGETVAHLQAENTAAGV